MNIATFTLLAASVLAGAAQAGSLRDDTTGSISGRTAPAQERYPPLPGELTGRGTPRFGSGPGDGTGGTTPDASDNPVGLNRAGQGGGG